MKKILLLLIIICSNLISQNKLLFSFDNYPISINKVYLRGYNSTSSTVLCLYQSKDGFIWIGTNQGLFRFDGYNTKFYDKTIIKSLPSNTIRVILEDSKNNLWIGTEEGLILKNSNSYPEYHNFFQLSKKKIISLCEDHKGNILVGTSQELWKIKDKTVEPIIKFSKDYIITIAMDSLNQIWISSLDNGLFKYSDHSFEKIQIPDNDKITALYCDKNGILFAGSLTGIIYSLNKNGKIIAQNKLSNIFPITRIIKKNNTLWVSSLGGGLCSIDNNSLKYFGKEYGLFNNSISSLLLDNENNIWFGTIGSGTFIVSQKKIGNITTENGLTDNLIHTLFEDSEGNLWIGYAVKGIDKISPDGKIFHFDTKNGLSDNSINTICEDNSNKIWVGTQNNGINIFYNNKWNRYTNSKIQDKTIKTIFNDSKNNIWIGTLKGLYKIKDTVTFSYDVSSGLPSIIINSISEDKYGNIIIGTSKGISIYNNSKFINYNILNGLVDNNINTIYCSNDGIIWVGTENGLSQIKNSEITNYSSINGLYDDNIVSIIEDNNTLWFGSKKGIFYINKGEFFINEKANLFLFSVGYNSEDGMTSNECYGISQPSAIKTKSGCILFPTQNGISYVNPKHIYSAQSKIPPNIFISEFKVDNLPINTGNKIILAPGKKTFEFNISILSFTNPEKNRYRYMLVGYDEDWKNGISSIRIQYQNLPPGEYTLKVIGCNSDGKWNFEGASLTFTLKPHFYQTKAFLIVSISLIIILIISLENLRVKRIERRKKELETIVELRTKELQEINKTKDKLFSIISHDLRGSIGNFMSMLKLLVEEPDVVDEKELQDILKTMKESSESTYYLLDNLLNWARSQRGIIEYDFKNQQINPLIDDIIFLFNQIAKTKQITLTSKLSKPYYAYFDKNTTHTVIRNLVSNALKFTNKNGNIWIDAEENDNFITISINDDGVGIPPEKVEQIFSAFQGSTTLGTAGEKGTGLGLLLCKEFIEKNGGKIWVESTLGKGSSFKFTLPSIKEN